MEEEFVPYQEALALKELGFDEPCLKFYPTEEKLVPGINVKDGDTNSELNQYNKLFVSAPLYQQAFRWFREKHGWVAEIHGSLQMNCFYANLLLQAKGEVSNIKMCDTYEEAELECLKKLINMVKNKEFIPYQEALALKELGFDEPCFAWHVSEAYGLEFGRVIKDDLLNDAVLAPTWGVAFRWLYQKLGIEKDVMPLDTESQKLLLKELINIVKNNE